jgi:FtsH-binding integral membrane protein
VTFQNNSGQGWGSGATGPGAGSQVTVRPTAEASASFLTHAFTWMFAGLLLSAGVALLVQGSESLQTFAQTAFLPVIIGQLVLVVAISWGISRIGATVALGLFFIYAASIGLTVGLIIAVAYQTETAVSAFLTASGMFGVAALYGATTKRSLAGIGGFLTMGLIGLLIALVVNAFLGSDTFGYVLSIIGVVLFTALTAYDVQRISTGQLVAQTGSVEKAAVIGALRLYLDFINLFLFLLRLFGGRR